MLFQASNFHDGLQKTNYHPECCFEYFSGILLHCVDDILQFEALRNDDQMKLRKLWEEYADENDEQDGVKKGYMIEKSKSGKSKCRSCLEFIEKNHIRMGFKVLGAFGLQMAWYHVDCFMEQCNDMASSVKQFGNWDTLEQEEIDRIESLFAKVAVPVADKQVISKVDQDSDDKENLIRKQNDELWKLKDDLNKKCLQHLTLKDRKALLIEILHNNNIQLESKSHTDPLDVVIDCALYGLPKECPDCGKSRLMWSSIDNFYKCPTFLEWGKCTGKLDSEQGVDPNADLQLNLSEEWYAVDENGQGVKKYAEALLKSLKSSKKRKRVMKTKVGIPKSEVMTTDDLAKKRKRKLEEETNNVSKVYVKNGYEIDAETELQETHHIYVEGDTAYTATLSSTDVHSGRNAFYKLQLLEPDSFKGSYYLFRSWGRVASNAGGTKLQRFMNVEYAKEEFCNQFLEKTGNEFEAKEFVKKPKKFYPLAVEAKALAKTVDLSKEKVSSSLAQEVQDLLMLIFDQNLMKKALKEMDLDLQKMPLGNISETQVKKGYSVLSEIEQILSESKTIKKSEIQALSSKFFTIIPHNFARGMQMPLLDNHDFVKEKIKMLDNMMEISAGFEMLKVDVEDSGKNLLDSHYEALNTEITVLPQKATEFALIEKYVNSTHAPTHKDYKLDITAVFKVARSNEMDIYKEHIKQNPRLAENRLMLWHGSRVTNFAGILHQGLRIAPAEAPVTGYMFGKGIYFADMVTKSANYCCATPEDPTGLLILCETALGDMHELTESEFIEELPDGKFSTKGLGKTIPSGFENFPTEVEGRASENTDSGYLKKTRSMRSSSRKKSVDSTVVVPIGPPTKNSSLKKSELLYNEYVVYNPKQVCIRYLVQVKFEFKGRKSGRR